ncbi:MAG: hypothetical protein AB1592_18900 [Pseudomonadota bacterium]
MKLIPSVHEIAREALVVLVGALVATIIVRGLPSKARRWFSWPASED